MVRPARRGGRRRCRRRARRGLGEQHGAARRPRRGGDGAEGRDIVATGSVQLVHALIAAGLLDEFRLFVFPVDVGHGARLFDGPRLPLQMLETRPFVPGAVLLRYAVTPGSTSSPGR